MNDEPIRDEVVSLVDTKVVNPGVRRRNQLDLFDFVDHQVGGGQEDRDAFGKLVRSECANRVADHRKHGVVWSYGYGLAPT